MYMYIIKLTAKQFHEVYKNWTDAQMVTHNSLMPIQLHYAFMKCYLRNSSLKCRSQKAFINCHSWVSDAHTV